MNRKSKLVRIIKRSCLTGKVVWIYHGRSHEAGRKAYVRACKKEVRRIRQWTARMAVRQKALMRLIGFGDSSSSGINDSLTPEQKAAAREIIRLGKQQPPQARDFYDHIVEESKRRNWKSDRWKENRTNMVRYGKCK